jgi:hypothetical protein
MTDTKALNPIAGTSLRSHRSSKSAAWTDNWAQAQGEQHVLTGYHTNGVDRFRHFLHFDMGTGTWSDVDTMHKAELHVFTAADHAGFVTAKPSANNLKLNYHTQPWAQAGGGEALWNADMAAGQVEGNDTYRSYAKVSEVALHETVIDVTAIVRAWAPKSVKWSSGGTGYAHHNSGFLLQVGGGSTAQNNVNRAAMASENHVNTAIRPFLVLTYDRKGGPGLVTLTAPDGDIPRGIPEFFTGEYEPGRTGDKISSVEVQVTATGEPTKTWKTTASSNDVATSTFSVAVPVSLKSGTQYNWTARVYNQRGEVTPYPAVAQVRWTQAAGGLTLPSPSGPDLRLGPLSSDVHPLGHKPLPSLSMENPTTYPTRPYGPDVGGQPALGHRLAGSPTAPTRGQGVRDLMVGGDPGSPADAGTVVSVRGTGPARWDLQLQDDGAGRTGGVLGLAVRDGDPRPAVRPTAGGPAQPQPIRGDAPVPYPYLRRGPDGGEG